MKLLKNILIKIKNKFGANNTVGNQKDTNFEIVVKDKVIDALNRSSADTFIAEDAIVTGTLKISGKVFVAGKVSGNINQSNLGASLYVAQTGIVRGNTDVSNTLLSGEIEGALRSALVGVEKSAKFSGVLTYETLVAEGGLGSVMVKRDELLMPIFRDDAAIKRIK